MKLTEKGTQAVNDYSHAIKELRDFAARKGLSYEQAVELSKLIDNVNMAKQNIINDIIETNNL
jgi:hypothetical protein